MIGRSRSSRVGRTAVPGLILIGITGAVIVWQLGISWDQLHGTGLLQTAPAVSLALAAIAAAAIVAIGVVVAPPAVRKLLLAAFTAVSIVVVVVTSAITGNTWALLLAVLAWSASWQVGDWLIRMARVAVAGAARWIIALAVGAGVLAFAIYVLALVSGVTWWSVGVPVVVVGLVGVWSAVARAKHLPRPSLTSAAEVAPLSLMVLVWGAAAIWTAAPEIQYDALWGKAWLPALWSDRGALVFDPHLAETFAVGNTLFIATSGHVLGAPAIGRYMALTLGLVLALAIWSLGRQRANGVVGGILALAFLVTPQVFWQMTTANDDLTLCLFALGLALAIVVLPRGGSGAGILVGVAAASAINGKLHLAVFAAAAVVAWLVVVVRERRMRAIAGVIAGLGTVAGVPLLIRWAQVGNPVYPGMNNVFKSASWPEVNETFNFPYASDGSLGRLARFAWDAVSDPTVYMEVVPRGAFGVLISLLLGFLLVGWWRARREVIAVWIALVLAFVVWWVTVRYLRYLLPYAYVATAFAMVPMAAFGRTGWGRSLTTNARPLLPLIGPVVVAAWACAATAAFWNIPERVPWRVAFGLEDQSVYEKRVVGNIAAVHAINRLTPTGARVVVDSGHVFARVAATDGRILIPLWEFSGLAAWQSARDGTPATGAFVWARDHVAYAALVPAAATTGQSGTLAQEVATGLGRRIWTGGGVALYRIPGVQP